MTCPPPPGPLPLPDNTLLDTAPCTNYSLLTFSREPCPLFCLYFADNTLVDAVSCTIAPNDWDLLDWRYVLVTNSYGRQIRAQYAPLPGHDPFSGGLRRRSLAGWRVGWYMGACLGCAGMEVGGRVGALAPVRVPCAGTKLRVKQGEKREGL